MNLSLKLVCFLMGKYLDGLSLPLNNIFFSLYISFSYYTTLKLVNNSKQ